MAEFKKVMEQWRRFCKSHSNCGECEFDGKGICCETHLSGVPYSDIELRIMSWAAEHPEPVYPTWRDLFEIMGANIRCDGTVQFQLLAADKPIPADIAQKLGIEPKEVQHG